MTYDDHHKRLAQEAATGKTNAVVARIFNRLDIDIRDRRGLKSAWTEIEDDVMNGELRPAWEHIIRQEIAPIAFDRDKWRAQAERTCKIVREEYHLGFGYNKHQCGTTSAVGDSQLFCKGCGGRIVKEGQ